MDTNKRTTPQPASMEDQLRALAKKNGLPFRADGAKPAATPKPEPEPPKPVEAGRIVTARWASTVTDGVPEWAFKYDGVGAMARRTLNLFAGRPGAGKSTAARWFAAGYTRGTLDGCFVGKPQNVAYVVASEESIEYMVKPSLRAVHADMNRILFPHAEMDGRKVSLLSVNDEAALTELCRRHNVTVIIVDPVMSTVGGLINIDKNNQTRIYIEPWARIAEAIGGVAIGVVHLVKSPGADIVAAINGSSAFGEVARGVIAFAKDPESTDGHRIMSQVKNSAGPEDLSLAYRIEPSVVMTTQGHAEVAKFTVVGPSERTVSDVMAAGRQRAQFGPRMLEVLEAARAAGGTVVGPNYIATAVKGMSRDEAGKYLRRLAEANLLTKTGRGLYVYRLPS